MSNLIIRCLILGILSLGLVALPAYGFPPEERVSCALGWYDAEIEATQIIDPAEFIDIRLSTRGGDGNAGKCSINLYEGLYGYGEYGRAEAKLDVALTLDDETGTGTFGLDAEFQRIGLGFARMIGEQLRVHGQIGYLKSDYDFDQIFVILPSGAGQLGPAKFRNRTEGVDLQGGMSWRFSDRIEVGGYARLAAKNRLSFDNGGSIAFEQKNKDDLRIGAKFKLQLMESVFVSADAEFGEMDTLFVGLGAQF